MKKNYIKIFLLGAAITSLLSSCGDGWFERDPKNILTNEQVWNDPAMIKSQLANLYDRIPQLHGNFNTGGMCETDDAMYCGTLDQNYRNELRYGNDYGRWWDYEFIRDINMSIENITKYGTEISEESKNQFIAEFRFIRAYVYFELVRRMGGVPLITQTLEYDFNGDPSYLRTPRAKEHEIYDFIYKECEEIKNQLGNANSQTRANYYTALALESRAMLYAGSIAKYNALKTPNIVTSGGEVGIPSDMANGYYQKSLSASKEIIEEGGYELYNKEEDKECEEIKNQLGNANSQTRANYYTALALESRAMLYAGSIAKYNALKTPNIVTSGGEVGIPSDMANGYYQKSLSASKEIIEEGGYELYNKEEDKGINFYKMLMDKTGNKEVIWVKDYQNPLKVHSFGYDNVIHHLREDNDNSSCIGPSLGLVEAFDYLDGTSGTLHYKNGNDYIVYKNPSDIFANKDARLYGTIIYPGTKFRGQDVDIQAGVAVWNDINGSYDLLTDPSLGSFYTDNKTFVGQDGPQTNTPNVSNTGFYIRKFISEASGYTLRNYAENWWPWFRLGEIYLNATEAAFELNDETNALHYINKLRERAGFPANSLNKLTIEKIQNERRVELAFEDHRYFDMKRWRIADAVWNGNEDNDQAIVYGLYPYRIAKAKPGTQDQDKYIFVKTRSERFKVARTFQQSNYYSFIEDAVINNNPTIVKNPFQ